MSLSRNTFTVHCSSGVATLLAYKLEHEEIDRVFESPPFTDGSCIAIIETHDQMLRFHIEKDLPDVMVMPHPHAARPIGPKIAKRLADLSPQATDRLEDVLLEAVKSGKLHLMFHPDLR